MECGYAINNKIGILELEIPQFLPDELNNFCHPVALARDLPHHQELKVSKMRNISLHHRNNLNKGLQQRIGWKRSSVQPKLIGFFKDYY